MLQLQSQVSLQSLNSFHLPAQAESYIALTSPDQLGQLAVCLQGRSSLVLGGGSNTLFYRPYHGVVIHNQLAGRHIEQDSENWYLTLGAGEDWHGVIVWALQNGIGGLENLALIPGTVGAAPVQNIGSYGCDFAQLADWVEYYDVIEQRLVTLTAHECEFAYRSSIFKTALSGRAIITSVGLKLAKSWQPNLSYGPLTVLDVANVTPQQVFDRVVATRMAKLPDPAVVGNAGSFFKNPQIPSDKANALLAAYPEMPVYAAELPGYKKLAAGWLIDQCGLKGYAQGGAKVHEEQALVLVNYAGASADDVIALADYVQQSVAQKFAVSLEPEVRIIGENGEISFSQAVALLSRLSA